MKSDDRRRETGSRTRVKICCIANPEEARTAIGFGADAIGLVGKMPSGPGVIGDSVIREIAALAPPAVETFLLTSETEADDIISHYRRTLTTAIQIVDYVEENVYEKLRREIPSTKIVQVIHVEDESCIDRAMRVKDFVNGILLDSGRPNANTKILGGTGITHNWEISGEIVERTGVPVFLAGGITPENIGAAVMSVRPFGIDACTGVRTAGILDRDKLKRLFEEIARVDRATVEQPVRVSSK
ncbi:MAG TPA: phosphoribosylanthranilate isomerase [Candidatus Kryptonia bacterium]